MKLKQWCQLLLLGIKSLLLKMSGIEWVQKPKDQTGLVLQVYACTVPRCALEQQE